MPALLSTLKAAMWATVLLLGCAPQAKADDFSICGKVYTVDSQGHQQPIGGVLVQTDWSGTQNATTATEGPTMGQYCFDLEWLSTEPPLVVLEFFPPKPYNNVLSTDACFEYNPHDQSVKCMFTVIASPHHYWQDLPLSVVTGDAILESGAPQGNILPVVTGDATLESGAPQGNILPDCGVQVNTDVTPFHPIEVIENVGPNDLTCLIACRYNPACVYWQHQKGPIDGQGYICALSDVAAKEFAPLNGTDSGPVCGSRCTFSANTAPSAGFTQIAHLTDVRSDPACSIACVTNAQCVYWVHDYSHDECWLSSTVPTASEVYVSRNSGARCSFELGKAARSMTALSTASPEQPPAAGSSPSPHIWAIIGAAVGVTFAALSTLSALLFMWRRRIARRRLAAACVVIPVDFAQVGVVDHTIVLKQGLSVVDGEVVKEV